MTTITLPRATVEQALEALESVLCDPEGKCCIDGSDADRAVVDKALAAFRAALAQQAEPAACSNTFGCRCPKHFAVEQAEPVEPVAEARYDGTLRWLEPHGVGLHRIQGPLFTAPPQRKPLTEGVLMGVYIDFDRAADPAWSKAEYLLRLFRAVERAHGITDPQIEDHLARHGIPMPGDPK